MPYIGAAPSSGLFKKLDSITVVNGQAAYTMQYNSSNFKPGTASQLIVSVNGVIQAPEDAFTIDGSTITFTENLVTGDVIDFIVALGEVGNTVTPVDGSVTTAKLANDAVTSDKLANSLDMQNITLKGGTTDALTIDSSGRVLFPARPAFSAYASSGSPLTSAGTVVLPLTFTNQGSHYSTTTGQFTAPVAGTYYFHHHGTLYGAVSRSWDFEKNGTTVARHVNERVSSENGYYNVISGDIIIDMAANDTMEVSLVGGSYYLGTAIVYRPVFCGYLLA